MAYASMSALSGRFVRSHLRSIGAFTGAGILVLSVVTAPPDAQQMRTEIPTMRLTASALPAAAYVQALEGFVSQGARSVVPTAELLTGGGRTSGATVTSPTSGVTSLKLDSTAEPRTADASTLAVSASALAAPSLPAPFGAALGIIAILILFSPLILLVVLSCPLCALINELSYFVPFVSPVGALSAASLAAAPVVEATTFAAGTTTDEQAESSPPTDPVKAPPTSNGKRTRAEAGTAKKSAAASELKSTGPATKEVTKGDEATEATKAPKSVGTPKHSSAASTSKPENGSGHGSHNGEGARSSRSSNGSSEAHSNSKGNSSKGEHSSDGDS
jgi:hypothetical protein